MRTYEILKQARFAKADQAFSTVCLPHTWNNLDGQDGNNDYHRGLCTYQIDLPAPTQGKRQYIEIQGANHIATVYCNGKLLGTHKGGFSTFRYELTDAMEAENNLLTVEVTNEVCHVYPQRADFTFFGGLYRTVAFIEAENTHFDLLKNGTDAVFATPYSNGRVRFDLFPVNGEGCEILVEVMDAQGNVVAREQTAAQSHTSLYTKVEQPRLWHGVEDPYCYGARAAILKDGEVLDLVQIRFGFRSFHVDARTGFYLNGKSVPLHGVSRHQDRENMGWALTEKEHQEDMALIKEMGANTIRLAHYQHDQQFYDLCDDNGMVVWAEIPFISQFLPGKDAYDNTISQMTELIAQNYNHPSICFWGISNEITIGGFREELYRNLCDLNALCKRMDPSRLTTMAQIAGVPMDSEHNFITDVVSYNYYYGWYARNMEDNGTTFDTFHAMNPDRPYGISEYGADNLVCWHSAKPFNHDYTEEYACLYHHELLKTFATRPYLWATHMWNMFDFAVDARDEGGCKGRNTKGLVTYDRKLKKDSYFLYQAYWTKVPMIHIAGRRFADRAPDERTVTVYTNCDNITLYVNGQQLATAAVQDHAAVFENVPLQDGENILVAKGQGAEDTITLNGVAEHNTAYDLPDIAEALSAGNWFEQQGDTQEDLGDKGYDIEVPLGQLLANEACMKAVRGWIMSKKDLEQARKMTMVSRLPSWQTTWGDRKIYQLATLNKALNQEDFDQLNKMLGRIKKD